MKRYSGFTLIELLIVVFIIAILASIALIATGSARITSRDARRKADVRAMATALEAYTAQKGGFGVTEQWAWSVAAVDPTFNIQISTNCGLTSTLNWSGSTSLQQQLAAFIQLPMDPINGQAGLGCGYLTYAVNTKSDTFEIFSFLENVNDVDRHQKKRYQTDLVADCTPASGNQAYKGIKFASKSSTIFTKFNQMFFYTNNTIQCP